tara:strand:- start:4023 stop:4625 length:603 start_codon:yes stop_codon:yes gene_type:complete
MHWVYLLKCENDLLYVGETKQLYTRIIQHMNNKGSKHTQKNKPIQLLGLYKVHTNYHYLQYCKEITQDIIDQEKINNILYSFNITEWNNKDWARIIEDFITEHLLLNSNHIVFGGKYVNEKKLSINKAFNEEELKKIPLCNCNIPAEIKLIRNNKYNKLYFTCSLKNIWYNMRNEFKLLELSIPCNYYKELYDDLEYRMI